MCMNGFQALFLNRFETLSKLILVNVYIFPVYSVRLNSALAWRLQSISIRNTVPDSACTYYREYWLISSRFINILYINSLALTNYQVPKPLSLDTILIFRHFRLLHAKANIASSNGVRQYSTLICCRHPVHPQQTHLDSFQSQTILRYFKTRSRETVWTLCLNNLRSPDTV